MEEIKSPLLEIKPKKEHYGGYVAAFSILSILLLLGLALPVRDAASLRAGDEGILGEFSIIFMAFFGGNDYVYILFKFFSAIGLVMSMLCLISAIRCMSAKGVLLVADDDGIVDNVSEYRLGSIPWDDIHDIELKSSVRMGVKKNVIEITIEPGEKYLSAIKKRIFQKPKLTGAGMLETHIVLRDADADSVQIAVVLRELLAEHRKTITVRE